jgi:hypothetical protein
MPYRYFATATASLEVEANSEEEALAMAKAATFNDWNMDEKEAEPDDAAIMNDFGQLFSQAKVEETQPYRFLFTLTKKGRKRAYAYIPVEAMTEEGGLEWLKNKIAEDPQWIMARQQGLRKTPNYIPKVDDFEISLVYISGRVVPDDDED